MNEKLTGTEHPVIELAGVKYPVKFTRGMLYNMGVAGIKFNPVVTAGTARVDFHVIVDVMKLAIEWPGTAQELAEVLFDKRDQALTMLMEGWGNLVLPSLQSRVQSVAAKQETDQVQ